MVEVNILKNRIIDVLKKKGPSLPIQIAKEISQNSIFTSAFLSELTDEKRVKTSDLKVGGSHLYLLEGQESQLEKFSKFLHPKEAEALILLKKNKILKDSEQEPAIRVALREIKDFAESFKNDNEIYWKHILMPQSEVEIIFQSKPIKQETKEVKQIPSVLSETEPIMSSIPSKPVIPSVSSEFSVFRETEPAIHSSSLETEIVPKEIKKTPEKPKPKKIRKPKEEILEPEQEFQNPLIIKPIEKPKKDKPKSIFVLRVINFIEKNNFRIIEEKDYKTREYNAIIQTDSTLGPINYLTQAKDKRIVIDSDLKKLLYDAQSIPLPALILYSGELNKKAKEYLEKYYSILKAKRIE
jgi:hypothetical protein